LIVYKINDGSNWMHNVNKMVLLTDSEGKYLDAFGVQLPDNEFGDTTFVNNSACLITVQTDEVPVLKFLYINSESDTILLLPRNNRFIAFVCISGDNIYYSTENDYTSVWRVSTKTGIIFTYPGYYPNVDLFEVKDNGVTFVYFSYEDQNFIINKDIMTPTSQNYAVERKKQVGDYVRY
jgi:hypothetical protein